MSHKPDQVRAVAFVVMVTFGGALAAAETSTTYLREQTRDQLRLESIAQEGTAKDDAVVALCDLYVVLRSDARYATSKMLQGDAAKVRRRLLTVARRREVRLGRQGIDRPKELSRAVDRAIEASLSKDSPSKRDSSKRESSETGDQPIAFSASGGGAAAGAGWQLVELIERVVAPEFWESRGGAGSIQYFAARRVLVVRATSDVHQQVKDLLTALR